MLYSAVIQTPIGTLGICTVAQQLARLDFLADHTPLIDPGEKISKLIVNELEQYFKNSGFQFNIPYSLQGTPFQKRVWGALSDLPMQRTISYGTLAKRLNTSARAVGSACRTNPIPILIPCHRVVTQQGLGGYKGKKLFIKKWLLTHESS
jgi:methylated-DNA-[protein]-cysteine S-methyltransferase